MNIHILTPADNAFPAALRHIAKPPRQLYVAGENLAELLARPRLAVVGSRKVSSYGKSVTINLCRELAEEGVVIVSGLAIGVDGIAHRAAVEAGGATIAVLPGDLTSIYPAVHSNLAQDIIAKGGALVSEYATGSMTYKSNFVARNRIVAGLSQGVLITEAALKSGSLHTARFALEQGIEVLAVPGPISSATSEGANNLIKSGAAAVTNAGDVLHALGMQPRANPAAKSQGANATEQLVLNLLNEGPCDGHALLAATRLEVAEFHQTLTMLEITGKVRALGANQWTRS